jgi:Immunity protein 26
VERRKLQDIVTIRLERPDCPEGSVFLVPLPKGGFARGVIARANGPLFLGYFFGPAFPTADGVTLSGLDPANAIFRGRFGELSFRNGSWRILGPLLDFKRENWPVPGFLTMLCGVKGPLCARYSDDLVLVVSAERISEDEARGMATDNTYAAGRIELLLAKRLGIITEKFDDPRGDPLANYPDWVQRYFGDLG